MRAVEPREIRSDGRPAELVLRDVVESLCDGNGRSMRPKPTSGWQRVLPSRDAVVDIVSALREVLFPGYFGPTELTDETVRFHVGSTLSRVRRELSEQLARGLRFGSTDGDRATDEDDVDERAASIVDAFLSTLPSVQRLLTTDVRASYEGDPAATCVDEAIFCYPGILATMSQRLAHELHELGVPLLPRMITEHAHSVTGIDIHPGARIGESFFIDHGTGLVIGETCEIGKRVTLYQGVTLGAKSFPRDENGDPIKGIPRHPIVEDDVIIYGGATILGRVTIGRGSVIGGNVWLTRSVPPGSRITQARHHHELYSGGAGI